MKQVLYLLIILLMAIYTAPLAQQNEISSGARDDLERFTGLYGDPEEKNEYRKLWVMVSCDGYLVSGALWGDVAPWWMTSEADNIFTYADSFFQLRFEFETDENGNAVKMIHDLEWMKSPLERAGPLPDDWDPCIERPKR